MAKVWSRRKFFIKCDLKKKTWAESKLRLTECSVKCFFSHVAMSSLRVDSYCPLYAAAPLGRLYPLDPPCRYAPACINSTTSMFRDEDPVLAKNRIRGSVAQTKGDFEKSIE